MGSTMPRIVTIAECLGSNRGMDSKFCVPYARAKRLTRWHRVAEMKQEYSTAAELASPTPGQQTFTAELEAPGKGTR